MPKRKKPKALEKMTTPELFGEAMKLLEQLSKQMVAMEKSVNLLASSVIAQHKKGKKDGR